MKYNKIQVEVCHVFCSEGDDSPKMPAILMYHGVPGNSCRMKVVMKHVKDVTSCICNSLILLLLMSSCSASKNIFSDVIVDSITDPKTGTSIFIRKYDTEPYQINVVEILKSRKAQKKILKTGVSHQESIKH